MGIWNQDHQSIEFQEILTEEMEEKNKSNCSKSATADTCKGWHMFSLVTSRNLGVLWGGRHFRLNVRTSR